VQFTTNLRIQQGNVIAVLLELTKDGGHIFIASFVSRSHANKVLFGHD
jgi:hypothetical protein